MNPVEKKEVKTKSLKALEKLGHTNLELDEYESEWHEIVEASSELTSLFMQGR